MSQYQRILLIADPGMQRTPAFERAVWLARRTGASLHMAVFDRVAPIQAMGVFDATRVEAARDAFVGEQRRWLQQQAGLLRSQGCAVTADAVWADSPKEEMLAYIAEYAPDLAIKDVRHESALKRLLLRPLDWDLLRESPVPLLLVGTLAHAVPRRVLAAIDVSQGPVRDGDLNDSIVKSALALAIQCDAELHLA